VPFLLFREGLIPVRSRQPRFALAVGPGLRSGRGWAAYPLTGTGRSAFSCGGAARRQQQGL